MTERATTNPYERPAELTATHEHRPWPLPEGPWAQLQTRRDVLFAHWPVALDQVSRLLPPGLPLDTFDGEAWLGMVASRVEGLRVRGLPPVPGLSSYPQLEVLTYVTVDGRPGVWAFSVETTKAILVEALRRSHRLPAYRADITVDGDSDSGLTFDATRDSLGYRAHYRPAGTSFMALPGTLDHFLVERYAVYTGDGGRLYRADLHHAPWSLEPARAEVETVTLAPVALEAEPRLLYSATQDLLVWPLEEL